MSENESTGSVNVSISLPPPSASSETNNLDHSDNMARSAVSANSDLEQVRDSQSDS